MKKNIWKRSISSMLMVLILLSSVNVFSEDIFKETKDSIPVNGVGTDDSSNNNTDEPEKQTIPSAEEAIGIYYYESWDAWADRENSGYEPIFVSADDDGYIKILSQEELNKLIEEEGNKFIKEGYYIDGWYEVDENTEEKPENNPRYHPNQENQVNLKESINLIPLWDENNSEDTYEDYIPIWTDILYHDGQNWNTQNSGIPVIRNFEEHYINKQEKMKMRVALDFCELVGHIIGDPSDIDEDIEYIISEKKDHDYKAETNFSIDIKLPVGLEYIDEIKFTMEKGNLFKLAEDKVVYDTANNIVSVPIVFSNKYDGDINAYINLLRDLKESISYDGYCCYNLKGFIDITVITNDQASGYMTTFAEGKGSFEFEDTCKCEPGITEKINKIIRVCHLGQVPENEDFILKNPWLIDVGATSAEDYENKIPELGKEYCCKPTLTVLAPFRTNADLLIKKKAKIFKRSIADEYTTEHDKVFDVKSDDVVTILGTLDTYPAIKLFKNIFYFFENDGSLEYIPASGFTSEFKAKLIIPKGIDIIDSTIKGIKKSLTYEMNNGSTMYEIKKVEYEDGFTDGSKEITINFGLKDDYSKASLKDLEEEIDKTLSGYTKQSLDNYLYMTDNLRINDKSQKSTIELKVSGDTKFFMSRDSYQDPIDLNYTYFGSQTEEGRDFEYNDNTKPEFHEDKNKIFLTVKSDVEPDEIYKVTYHGNENTGGSVPTDDVEYNLNDIVIVKDKSTLTKTNYKFKGWSENKNYKTADYNSNETFNITKNMDLYAVWEKISTDPEKPTDPGNPVIPTDPTGPSDTPSTPVTPNPVPELNKDDHYAYMIGYKGGYFKPSDNITRAEAITIFFRMLTENSRNKYWSSVNEFKDVKETAWYNNAVSTMANAKVIEKDKNGNFRPNEDMTRGEFAVLLSKFFNESGSKAHNFTDIKGHFAENEIARVAAKGWIEGYTDKTFRPDEPITRAETVKLVNKILERTPDIKNLLPKMIEFKDNQNKDKWYYVDVQEATNSHEYTRKDNKSLEKWTKLLPARDWSALEKEWSKSNSSANPGDVK